jgi:hypothetical protein
VPESVDPYKPQDRMPPGLWITGRHVGQRIDVSERRPLRLLSSADAAPYAPAEGEIVAANFIHEGKFFIAKFPAAGVDKVIFQKWDFGEMRVRLRGLGRLWLNFDIFHVAHTELRFKMLPGCQVHLYPQCRPQGVEPDVVAAFKIDDVVSSVEAVGPAGSAFGIWGGLLNHMVAVRRFKSLEESYFERIIRERRQIQQWEVAATPKQRQEIFSATIHDSHDKGLGALYHLFLNSCTSEAFRVIDDAMDYGIRTWRAHVFRHIPHFPEAYLWARRLLLPNGGSRLPLLNKEKEAWKEQMRERTSAYRAQRATQRARGGVDGN